MLLHAAKVNPQGAALVCGDDSLTYRDYLGSVRRLADEIRSLGIREGDARICLIMANSLDMAVAIFGVQAAGAAVVPLNPAYTIHELEPILRDADPRLLLIDEDVADALARATDALPNCTTIRIGPRTRSFIVRDDGDEVALGPERTSLLPPDAQSLSSIQYTGGTTGRSKGVMLSHAAVAANVVQREALLPTEQGERVLIMTPLFHVYAIAMGLYLSAYRAGTLFIMQRYKPALVLDAIVRHRITILAATPTIYTGLIASEGFAQSDFSSLKICTSGSAALPEAVLRRWEEATGCPICEGYGQTEAGPVLTHNPRVGPRKTGSVGTALPGTRIEIVDPGEGKSRLPVGETGEIRAQGPQIMQGYRNLSAQSADALRGGWLYTGDLGELDADGYLFIRGRKKDMVIVSGYNVYPREIEEVLHEYPGLKEIAVVGVPDDYRGEKLVGYVVGGPATAERLRDFAAARLAKYKIPSEFHFVEDLPRTGAGKIDKRKLIESHAAAAGEHPS